MNVKQVVALLKTAKKITITYDDYYAEFLKGDALMLEAYGKYVVDGVYCTNSDEFHYEIDIAMRPLVDETA